MSLSTVDNYLIALFLIPSSLITATTDLGNLRKFIILSPSKQVAMDKPRRIISNPKIHIEKLQKPSNGLKQHKQIRVFPIFWIFYSTQKPTEDDKEYPYPGIEKWK